MVLEIQRHIRAADPLRYRGQQSEGSRRKTGKDAFVGTVVTAVKESVDAGKKRRCSASYSLFVGRLQTKVPVVGIFLIISVYGGEFGGCQHALHGVDRDYRHFPCLLYVKPCRVGFGREGRRIVQIIRAETLASDDRILTVPVRLDYGTDVGPRGLISAEHLII